MVQFFKQTFRLNRLVIITALTTYALPTVFGQNIPVIHQQSIGGSNNDNLIYAGKITGSSSSWMYGGSSSPVDGSHTVPGYGNRDAWIVKLDADLNPVAQFGFGGTADEVSQGMLLGDDYILWAGYSFSGVSGNKTVPDFGMGDGYVIKMDTVGNVLWQEHYGGTDADGISSIAVYSDSSFVALAGTQSGISGNKTTPEVGINDIWLIEIALSDGHIIRQRTISSTYSDYGIQIELLSGGHLLIVAESHPGIGGDKTDYGFGNAQEWSDIWLLELDQNWNVLRDKCFGGDGQEEVGQIFQMNNRTFLVCNTYSQPSGQIVNPTFTANGYPDVWFVEVDQSWNILHEKTYGGDSFDQGGWLCPLSDQSIVLTIGSRSPSGTGNKTAATYGFADLWAIWLDENLNERAQLSYGSSGSDAGYFVPYDGDDLLIVMSSDGGISGVKTVNTHGQLDAWLGTIDLESVLGLSGTEVSAIRAFPNPFTDQVEIEGVDLAECDVFVFNSLGQQERVRANGQQINTSGWAAGVYVLSINESASGRVLSRTAIVKL